MILLDTNVLSELMRPSPSRRVVKWLDARLDSNLWISAVTVAEIRLGLSLLPDGARKILLLELAEQMFDEDFSKKCGILHFPVYIFLCTEVVGRVERF